MKSMFQYNSAVKKINVFQCMQHGTHVRNLTLFQIPLIYMCDFPNAISDLNYCSTSIYLRQEW